MSGLTKEQKEKIEEKKRQALERRAQRQLETARHGQANTCQSQNIPTVYNKRTLYVTGKTDTGGKQYETSCVINKPCNSTQIGTPQKLTFSVAVCKSLTLGTASVPQVLSAPKSQNASASSFGIGKIDASCNSGTNTSSSKTSKSPIFSAGVRESYNKNGSMQSTTPQKLTFGVAVCQALTRGTVSVTGQQSRPTNALGVGERNLSGTSHPATGSLQTHSTTFVASKGSVDGKNNFGFASHTQSSANSYGPSGKLDQKEISSLISNSPQKSKISVKGSCVLISPERFEVNVGYSAPLIEVFKSMPSKQYGL